MDVSYQLPQRARSMNDDAIPRATAERRERIAAAAATEALHETSSMYLFWATVLFGSVFAIALLQGDPEHAAFGLVAAAITAAGCVITRRSAMRAREQIEANTRNL